MQKEIKDIIKNSFYLYLIQGLNYLLPLISLPFLLIKLSTESFGRYSFAFAFAQFIILFVDFGFNLSATKKIAENSEDAIFVKRTFWNIIGIKLCFLMVATIFAVLLSLTIDKLYIYKEGIWIALITVLGTVLFPIWWFQGLNKMKLLSVINATSKLLTFPFLFILVRRPEDANIAIFIQSSSMLLAGLLSIGYLFTRYRSYFLGQFFSRNFSDYWVEVKASWPIFLSNSSISLYTNSLTLVLGIFSTTYQVGLFGAMERIVRVVCFGILGPVNQACFPILAKLKQTDFRKAKMLFKLIFYVMLLIMTITFFAFYLAEDYLFFRFFNSFQTAEKQLLLLFMAMIFPIALGGICGQLGLLALGNDQHKRKFANVYMVVGVFSIPLSVAAIYFFNIYGAVYSMILVEMTIFISLFYLVKKYKFI